MTRWVVMPIVTLFTIVKTKVKIINMKYVGSEVSVVAWMIEISIFLLLKVEWIFLLLNFLRSFFSTHKTKFFVAKSFCCIWNFWVKISKFWNAKKKFKKLKTKKNPLQMEKITWNFKLPSWNLCWLVNEKKMFVCFFSARIKLPW